MIRGGPSGPFLIGIDVGSQSLRALLADASGTTIACASRPTPTTHFGHGRAEYDLDALWQSTSEVLADLAPQVPSGHAVSGLAVASMGEACVLMDEAGAALAPAIAWFDRRTEAVPARLSRDIGGYRLFAITGQPPDPTFTLCKLLWHRQATPELFARTRRVLNIADWIAFRLCGEAATDLSLASRTYCLDIGTRKWSRDLLHAAGIDPALLPPIRPSGTALGVVRDDVLRRTGLPGRPVVAVGGHDHVVGGIAAGVTAPGCLLDSMGTAEAIILSVKEPPLSHMTLALGFVQGVIGLHRPLAYVGGGINSSGGAVEWLRALLDERTRGGLLADAEATPPGSDGACFLPHLAYSPPPNPDVAARGAFVGLTAGTGRGALFRSVMEGLAMEARQMVDALTALPGVGRIQDIRVIGGSTQNPLFLRIKASVFGRPLTVIDEPEATALGAALLGGVAAGLWPDLDAALGAIVQERHVVDPDPAWVGRYADLFRGIYTTLYPALRPVNRALSEAQTKHAA